MKELQREVWDKTYRYGEETIEETWNRVAKALASIEPKDREKWEQRFFNNLQDFRCTLGGRILSNVGTHFSGNSLLNCFVLGRRNSRKGKEEKEFLTSANPDSIAGIYGDLAEQALTLKSEGGWGTNFSHLRPRGTVIKGIGAETPGAVAFMELFDKSSEKITSGSGIERKHSRSKKKIRKGAMMGILEIWHPDIIEFIKAKQVQGRLSKFNISVGVTDGFMKAVEEDAKWDLIFPDVNFEKYDKEWDGNIRRWKANGYPVVTYEQKSARDIWELIMESTYNRNEPGIFFIDTANDMNNLHYCEDIIATNPCIAGDSLIAVADGRNAVSIQQLAEEGKDVLVYSVNTETGKTEIKMGKNPRKTKINAKMVQVFLDDGTSVKVTPDHRFLTKDLTYVEAQDLLPNTSLFPFNSFETKNGYRNICNVGEKMKTGFRNRRQYRIISEYYGLEVDGSHQDIHHRDFNNKNDNIDNLVVLERSEHQKLHSEKIKGLNNPYHKMTQEWKHNFASHPGETNGRYIPVTNDQLIEFGKKVLLKRGKLTKRIWAEEAKEKGYPQYLTNKFRFKNFSTFKSLVEENHKVLKVEIIENQDVYNITVDDNHNYFILTSGDEQFVESSGICVKNCGEIPLPDGGVCLLGSINLVHFIDEQEDGKFDWDWVKLKEAVEAQVRMMDNVCDLSYTPIPIQKQNLLEKRRLGMGVLGYASALAMMKTAFNSEEALFMTEELMQFITNNAYQTSALLAAEKGTFPLYNEKEFLASRFVQENLWPETIELIKKHGMRNSHLLAIAPTGNTSIYAGIVSGGLEPVFSWEYDRWVIQEQAPIGMQVPKWWEGDFHETKHFKMGKMGDEDVLVGQGQWSDYMIDTNRGLVKKNTVRDYALEYMLEKPEVYGDPSKTHWMTSAFDLSVQDHLDSMKIFAKYIDQAISKTINVPSDYSYDDFKKIYMEAWKSKIKGITTYRAGTMTAVLTAKEEKEKETFNGEEIIKESIKLPDNYSARGTILRAEGKKWYIHTNFFPDSDRPFALFVSTNTHEPTVVVNNTIELLEKLARSKGIPDQWIEETLKKSKQQSGAIKIARMLSLCLRHGILMRNIVQALDQVEDAGVTTFVFAIKKYIASFIRDGEPANGQCPDCNSTNLAFREGCKLCNDCGWTACA